MAEEDGDEAYFNESDDEDDNQNPGPQPVVGGDSHEANGGELAGWRNKIINASRDTY